MARAAGIMLIHDGRVLLLKRAASAKDSPETWGLPGGHIEDGETPETAARREYGEECGAGPYEGALTALFESRDGFRCYLGTGYAEPELNDEHTDWKWAPFDDLPKPLHPSLLTELRKMPLIEGKGKGAFSENVKKEVEAGKPQKQAVAIAYSEKRKAGGKDAKMAKDAEPQNASCIERLHAIGDWFNAQGKSK